MSGQAYVGSAKRTFEQAVRQMLKTDYGVLGSRRVLELLAHDVQELVKQFYPAPERLSNGWMVFTGTLADDTKAYPGRRAGDYTLITLAWPVLTPEDIQALVDLPKGTEGRDARRAWFKERAVRLVEFGQQHSQGPVLLTLADLSLMLGSDTATISQLLAEARKETGKPLLTKGLYFDQGMRPTHKAQIIALYEAGVDEADIARQTQHSQSSVGVYIRGYESIKLLLYRSIPIDRFRLLTNMQPSVIKAYVELVFKYHPDLIPDGENGPSST